MRQTIAGRRGPVRGPCVDHFSPHRLARSSGTAHVDRARSKLASLHGDRARSPCREATSYILLGAVDLGLDITRRTPDRDRYPTAGLHNSSGLRSSAWVPWGPRRRGGARSTCGRASGPARCPGRRSAPDSARSPLRSVIRDRPRKTIWWRARPGGRRHRAATAGPVGGHSRAPLATVSPGLFESHVPCPRCGHGSLTLRGSRAVRLTAITAAVLRGSVPGSVRAVQTGVWHRRVPQLQRSANIDWHRSPVDTGCATIALARASCLRQSRRRSCANDLWHNLLAQARHPVPVGAVT